MEPEKQRAITPRSDGVGGRGAERATAVPQAYDRPSALSEHTPSETDAPFAECCRCRARATMPWVGGGRVSLENITGWTCPPMLCPDCSEDGEDDPLEDANGYSRSDLLFGGNW